MASNTVCNFSKLRYGVNGINTVQLWNYRQYLQYDCTSTTHPFYSRVPIRRGVLNKRSGSPLRLCHVLNKSSGSQDWKCIGWNISHNCHFEWHDPNTRSGSEGITPLKIDTLQNSVIQLKGTALFLFVLILLNIMSHLLVNISGQIQGVCRINVPCLVIGTRE